MHIVGLADNPGLEVSSLTMVGAKEQSVTRWCDNNISLKQNTGIIELELLSS